MTAKFTVTSIRPSKPSVGGSKPARGVKTRPEPKSCSWQPLAYMRKAVKFLLERGAAALFLDPGLGKTAITLATLKVLKRDKQMKAALVVAPLRPMHLVWPKELAKWTDFQDLSMGVLYGPDTEKVLREDHDIYVTNFDSLKKFFVRRRVGKTWKYELSDLGKVLMSKVDVLVIDELSKMKHTDTLRFKLLEHHLGKFRRRFGLTGSPASNGLLDLFGQCLILDGGRSLGAFVTHYREQYFYSVADFTYALKPFAEEAIHARLRPLAISMSAEDHLQLPPLRQIPVKLELPAEVREVYEEVERKFLTIIEREAITAPNAAAANMMCRQICSGALYLPQVDFMTGVKKTGPRQAAQLHDTKLEALVDLVDELQGQQVIIAYDFQHDLDNILKKYPHLPVFGKSMKQDAWIEDQWNRGQIAMCAGHPASIGHGLNLQGSNAHNIIWYTLTWDFELFDQLNRRLRRQGNKADFVNCFALIMKDTVEESVAVVLKSKERTQSKLMDALKRRSRLDD